MRIELNKISPLDNFWHVSWWDDDERHRLCMSSSTVYGNFVVTRRQAEFGSSPHDVESIPLWWTWV